MTNTITLLDIIEDTVVDGPGFRVSGLRAGCTHHCPGCHNPAILELHETAILFLWIIL